MKLVHTRIVTRDVARLSRFYREVTGLVARGDDRYMQLGSPDTVLAISSQEAIDRYSGGAAQSAANRSVILDFEVDDVDKERVRLASLVSEFVLEPTTQPWGNRSMLFRDPDGNLINFFSAFRGNGEAPNDLRTGRGNTDEA